MTTDADIPFEVPGDPEPTDNAPKAADEPKPKTTRKPRADKGKPKGSTGPRSNAKRLRAIEAAEGVSDVVSQLGIIATPFTPLGGAYLLASSQEAENVAASLAEVDPRVMAALQKAKRVTAWSGAASLAAGFVGAVLLERGMAPAIIGEVPLGPANVQLGPMLDALVAEGHYAGPVGPDDGLSSGDGRPSDAPEPDDAGPLAPASVMGVGTGAPSR